MRKNRTILRAPKALLAVFAACFAAPVMAQGEVAPPEAQEAAQPAPVEIYAVEIVAEYPHDPNAFTQGLLWHDGHLYESTGQIGESQIRRVDLETGEVLAASDIPADQFGEGLTLFGDELISLTWQHGAIHRWRLDDLSPVTSAANYPWEGWGLATLGDSLIASDGSAVIHVLDPHTYEQQRQITVTLDGENVSEINELEVIDGMIWANIWFTRVIVVIDPETGFVTKIIDLRPVADQVDVTDSGAVLNGIAYDAENDRLFVTGKLWPKLFEIRLVGPLATTQ